MLQYTHMQYNPWLLQMQGLEGEVAQLKSYKTSAGSLESEKRQLEERVEQLEFSLAEMEINANVTESIGHGDTKLKQIHEEKVAAEKQVCFWMQSDSEPRESEE